MNTAHDTHAKVRFILEQDEDGYPPSNAETLWALKLPNGHYHVDSIPFFVRGISSDDEIAVEEASDGCRVFRELIAESANSTFRLVLQSTDQCETVRDELAVLGCSAEIHRHLGLLAVDIPGTVEIAPFLEYIMSAQERGLLDIEEGALRHAIAH